jgi:hypothetical protein
MRTSRRGWWNASVTWVIALLTPSTVALRIGSGRGGVCVGAVRRSGDGGLGG